MRKPWKTKGKDQRKIRKENEDYPGGNASVDQMESTTLRLIPAKYNGTTIFVDRFLGFTYFHLMTSLSSEQTMAAKEMYEQIALTYGVRICGY